LHYPVQESAQAEVEWISGKVPAQDGLLARASKKLVAEEGLLVELGPSRLDRDLQKYIWNDKPRLSLKDLREYLNRYTHLPWLKNQAVLVKTVQAAISGMLPGPFMRERDDNTMSSGLARTPPTRRCDRRDSATSPDIAEASPGAGAARPGPRPRRSCQSRKYGTCSRSC
jgi:hypothetical protein